MRASALDRVLLLALALGLGAALLGPALGSLGERFLGIEFVDHHGTQWFYWFAERTVLHGDSPLHSDLFFHPWGKDVLGHTGANLLDAYAALPLRLLLGPVLGYNLFVLVGLIASAWAFRRLAALVCDDPLALGTGTILAATLPYALAEASEGRPTQAILLLPLLFLASLWRTGTSGGLRAPLLAGLWLALSGYQYWYYAFFGGMAALAHGLWRAGTAPAGERLGMLGRHAVIAVVSLGLVAPLAVPMLAGMEEVPGLLAVEDWGLTGAEPVVDGELRVGLMLWQPLRASVGFFIQAEDATPAFLHRVRWTPVVLLPLLALALWRPRRLHRGPWLAMVATTAVLALGPLLLVDGIAVPNLIYIGLVKMLSPLQRLWWPARAYALLGPLLLLGGVVGLAALRTLGGAWAVRLGAVVAVSGQALHLRGQELLPLPSWDATVPAGYRCLAQGPEGAVVDLPFAWTQAHLYYQTVHGRPMLGGMIENNAAFTPDEFSALRDDNSFLRRLIDLTGGGLEGEVEVVEAADREGFEALGYRYIVLQNDALAQPRLEGTLKDNAMRSRARRSRRRLVALLGEPVYDDARVTIFSLDGGSPCAAAPPEPDTVAVGRSGKSAAELISWNPDEAGFRWLFAREEAEEADGPGDPRSLLWGASEAGDED